jgi:xanthine/uracil permease
VDARSAGVAIAVLGLVLVLIGLGVASGALGWFGRLPGDLRFEGEHTRVYIPLASMLLISVVATVLLALLRRLF